MTADDLIKGLGYFVAAACVLAVGLGILVLIASAPSRPQQMEQDRIRREAKDRMDRENERLLDAAREMQLREEMERRRRGGR